MEGVAGDPHLYSDTSVYAQRAGQRAKPNYGWRSGGRIHHQTRNREQYPLNQLFLGGLRKCCLPCQASRRRTPDTASSQMAEGGVNRTFLRISCAPQAKHWLWACK